MNADELRAVALEVLATPSTGEAWRAEPGRLIPLAYKLARAAVADPAPIDVVLPCPRCGKLHIDAPEPEPECTCRVPEYEGAGQHATTCAVFREVWTNPPHKSHLCHSCGFVWRPADVPTNGVAAVKTRGERDSPADDGAAVDPAWVRSLGLPVAHTKRLSYKVGPARYFPASGSLPALFCFNAWDAEAELNAFRELPVPATRGEFRTACRVFGAKIAEPPS